ncbi:regulator of chromosome condensation [Anaeramoeba ignava]|uniref:Regulator of chromosome condensation n=1 Tax=Anaeramoeba ignava TaxID=1746090 RepID=A0A9Q0R4Y8_ANAIG|nr:regulator of chromosome condensation [Anaeramoeba ignava]
MQNYQKQNKKQNNDIWFFGENNFAFMMIYDYHPNIIKPIQLNNFHQTTEIEKIIITNFVIIIHEQNYQAIEYSQNLPKPQKIEIENIQKVSVGAFHLAILTKEGKAFAKGKYVNTKNPDIFNNLSDSIEDPNEIIIQDIVCGQISIYLLTSNQNAYGIGSNIFGQIGFDSQQVFNNPILMMKNVSKIFSGKFANHVFLLNSNQELFVCGNNDYSQLGLGKIKEKEVKKLTKIQNIPKGKIIDIQSGFYHTIMLIEQKGTRKLYSCGNYEYTGLGKKKNTSEFTGIKSPLFKNDNILDFSVGWNHTLVLTANGKLIGFGWNSHGQLGIGNTRDQPKPIQIKIPEISSNISNYHICCGFHNSFLYYSSPSFSNLEEDLIKLFRRKEFCDISFKAQNEEIIEAHKLILKYRLKDQNQN